MSMNTSGKSILDLLAITSNRARTGDYSDAARSLNQCIPLLQNRLLTLEKQTVYGAKISFSLETMLLMLEHKNWVAVADVIDYEFIPLWKNAFP
jgi:hypothetical protein